MSDQTRAQIIEAMARAVHARIWPMKDWDTMPSQYRADIAAQESDALDAALPLVTAALAEKVRAGIRYDRHEIERTVALAARLIEEGL